MEELLSILNQLHIESYQLLKYKFNNYFPNAGNIGIFCQSNEEFEKFNKIKEVITLNTDNNNQKYFTLKKPIVVPKINDIPEITYTYLYIRKPDLTPYGKYRGDIDFFTTQEDLNIMMNKVLNNPIDGLEIYHQKGVGNLIQISNPKFKTVAYLSTKEITENIRVRH